MTCEEYTLLEKLNTIATAEYKDMHAVAEQLTVAGTQLNDKCLAVAAM